MEIGVIAIDRIIANAGDVFLFYIYLLLAGWYEEIQGERSSVTGFLAG
jgi:hypothetical protein